MPDGCQEVSTLILANALVYHTEPIQLLAQCFFYLQSFAANNKANWTWETRQCFPHQLSNLLAVLRYESFSQ